MKSWYRDLPNRKWIPTEQELPWSVNHSSYGLPSRWCEKSFISSTEGSLAEELLAPEMAKGIA
jgi:hypothetical protein